MNVLTTPLQLPCGTVLENRIVKAAMSEQLADRRGRPTPELASLYRIWSGSGAAVLITGNVMISGMAVSEPRQVVLDGPDRIPLFRAWAACATENGTPAWVQLNHAGRQIPRMIQSRAAAPSAVRVEGPPGSFGRPIALSGEEIERIPEQFGRAAQWATAAGFTGVQIHAAHGYLLSQFLSPHTNVRSDAWGGSASRRRRLLERVVTEVRTAVGPATPVAVKVNASDFRHGGVDPVEAMETVAWLGERVDVLELSGGTFESAAMVGIGAPNDHREAYFIDFAHAAREHCRAPVMLTGGLRSVDAMRDALNGGACDLVGLARPFVHDPRAAASLILAGTPVPVRAPKSPAGRDPVLAAMAEIGWYTRQIRRIAVGRDARTPRDGTPGLLAYAAKQAVDAAQLRALRFGRAPLSRTGS